MYAELCAVSFNTMTTQFYFRRRWRRLREYGDEWNSLKSFPLAIIHDYLSQYLQHKTHTISVRATKMATISRHKRHNELIHLSTSDKWITNQERICVCLFDDYGNVALNVTRNLHLRFLSLIRQKVYRNCKQWLILAVHFHFHLSRARVEWMKARTVIRTVKVNSLFIPSFFSVRTLFQ